MTLLAAVPAAVRAGGLAGVPADVPVDPDAPTARRWLLEELARPEYSQRPSLLQRLWEWFLGLFDGIPALDAPPLPVLVGVLVALALLVGVALWVAGPVRLARRRARSAAVVAHDDDRTAAQMRAAADAAAERGDWTLAVAERFRAVVRHLEERVVIDPRPGRTAQEAAAAAGDRLPELAAGLHDGASLFDDVVYGELPAGPPDDARMRDLDARARAARAAVPAAAPTSGGRP
jgi:hypothetical protein